MVVRLTFAEWEQKALNHIDDLKDELVVLCQDLIRIPSWDRETRGEAEVAHRVGKTLEKYRIEPDFFTSHPNIDNLVATWNAGRGERLLFNGHADVVPAGADWTVDPFGAKIRDGFIYGRGAMDMKGGISSMTMAMCVLRDLEVPLKGSMILNVVGDEERQGVLGTAWCIENIWEKVKADAAIVPEPTGIGQLGQAVCIGEKGPVWIRITTKGEKAHGSIPAFGKNAIVMMLQLLQTIHQTSLPSVPPPIDRQTMVDQFAKALGVEAHLVESLLQNDNTPNPLSAGLEAMTTTLNIGTIQGGLAANVVPDRCESQVDFRILPGQKPQEMVDFILTQAQKLGFSDSCIIEIIEACEGTAISSYEKEPIVSTLYETSKAVLGPTIYFMVPFATDARLLRKAGLSAAVVYGPGNMTQAHVADETVAIDDLVKVAKVLAVTTIRYLGVKD